MTFVGQGQKVDWSKYQALTVERRENGILLITIGEPAGFPIPSAMQRHRELSRVWRDFADDPELRVAVITGRDRFYPVGGVTEMLEDPGNYERIVGLLKEAVENVQGMITCDKPIVSAINGDAMGTGVVIGLLADVSIAAEEARLVDGHLLQGLAAGDHSVLIWPILCGMAKAKYYLMASETLTGREAERIGLISTAVPAGEVLDRAMEVAQRMATGPQYAVRWTKRTLNHWLRTSTPAYEASVAFEGLTFFSPDFVEALTAMKESRSPAFAELSVW